MTMPIALPYGIRDIKLTAFTDATATVRVGTSVDLPYAQTMKFSETEDFVELRGDDGLITTRGKGPQGDWELGAGGLSPAAVALLTGATLSTSGVTPNRIVKIRKSITQVRPFFYVEGQSISDSGGDVHAILFRCRLSASLDGEFSDGTFYITSAKGTMLGSFEAATLGALYDFVQNETAVAIP